MNEIRTSFHDDLDGLGRDVARLGALVTEAVPRATAVLLESDLEAAQAMVENDDDLDRLTLSIEEQCHRLLTLQQPVASDLRMILSAMRLASEIERSGDLAVNIAKATRRIYGSQIPAVLRGLIQRMSDESSRLFRAAMDAYLDRDVGLAAALDDMDDTLDDLQGDFIEAVFTAEDAGELDLKVAVQMALIARFYERIGDHAVNIGERIQYLVTGWMPEQEASARALERARRAADIAAAGDDVTDDGDSDHG